MSSSVTSSFPEYDYQMPKEPEECLIQAGWENSEDRLQLWKAIHTWAADLRYPERREMHGRDPAKRELTDHHFQQFFKSNYAPFFLRQPYTSRNQSTNKGTDFSNSKLLAVAHAKLKQTVLYAVRMRRKEDKAKEERMLKRSLDGSTNTARSNSASTTKNDVIESGRLNSGVSGHRDCTRNLFSPKPSDHKVGETSSKNLPIRHSNASNITKRKSCLTSNDASKHPQERATKRVATSQSFIVPDSFPASAVSY